MTEETQRTDKEMANDWYCLALINDLQFETEQCLVCISAARRLDHENETYRDYVPILLRDKK